MIQGYNHSVIKIKNDKATSLAVKGQNTNVMVYQFQNKEVQINTDNYVAGEYLIQFFNGDEVLEQTTLKIHQNLKYVDAEFDPRSNNKKTLEAINAFLSGTASHQQKKVRVGDKEIQYSSFDQLLKWKQYYEREVRKQQGKPAQLRFEKLFYRGI